MKVLRTQLKLLLQIAHYIQELILVMDTGIQEKAAKVKRAKEVVGNAMQNLVTVIIIEDGLVVTRMENQNFVIPIHVF